MISKLLQVDSEKRVEFISEFFGDIGLAAYAEFYGNIPIDHVEVSTRIEQVPNPDSRVTLAAERDALGLNRVQLDWRLTSLEKHTIIRALDILGAELGRAGLGRLQVTIDENDSGWPEDLHGGWHHIGTTRMSEDPRQGVVDANCQVHGIANLFIAGSSVFPTSGAGTPTLTLVSLAIRLADYLKERMQA
jgi:choline dehydrogenase-like flavoprotein